MSLVDEMQAFVYAVEAESFSGAAQRLGVVKSIISRRISNMETRLGASLLNRTTRRLSLTETGQAYYERSCQILADIAEADEVAGRMQTALSGKLRVAAPMSFGISHLSSTVAEFLVLHPGLEIELELNDRRVDLVGEGYDLAVRIGKLPDSSLIARTLAPCLHFVCASPAYLEARGEPTSLDDLAREPHHCLIYRNIALPEQWRFRVDGEWKPVRVRAKRLGVNNGEVLRDAAVAGLGLVVLPAFIAAQAIRDGHLRTVLQEFELETSFIHAVWPPNRQLSAKVRAFVDHLAARFGGTSFTDLR